MIVASVASSLGLIHFVAVQAAVHRGDAGDFGHRFHLANLSMARLAFYSGLEMCAVIPRDARQHGIDAHPRNGLLGFGIRGELLNGGVFLRDRHLAQPAFCGFRSVVPFVRSWILWARLSIST